MTISNPGVYWLWSCSMWGSHWTKISEGLPNVYSTAIRSISTPTKSQLHECGSETRACEFVCTLLPRLAHRVDFTYEQRLAARCGNRVHTIPAVEGHGFFATFNENFLLYMQYWKQNMNSKNVPNKQNRQWESTILVSIVQGMAHRQRLGHS